MKRTLVCILALLMVLCTAASAETTTGLGLPALTIDFDSLQYEGNWWTFSDLDMALYLPSDWVENTENYVGGADYEFAFSPEDMSAYVNVRVILDDSAEDYSTRFEQMVEEVTASEAASDVSPASLNGIDMITYVIGERVGLGAVILTDDAVLMMESLPGTDENAALFMQILSTFTIGEA